MLLFLIFLILLFRRCCFKNSKKYLEKFIKPWLFKFFLFIFLFFYLPSIESSVSTIMNFHSLCKNEIDLIPFNSSFPTLDFLFQHSADCSSHSTKNGHTYNTNFCKDKIAYGLTPVIPNFIFSFLIVLFGYPILIYIFISLFKAQIEYACQYYINDDLSYEERLSQYWKYLGPIASPYLIIINSIKSNHFYWRIYQMFQELISFTITLLAALFPKYLIYIIPAWYFISFCIIFCCRPYIYVKNTVVDYLNEIVQFGCSFLPILNWYKISISENILFVIGIIVILTIAIIPTVMFLIDIFQYKEEGSEEEDISDSAESNDEKLTNGKERKIEKAKKNYKYGRIPDFESGTKGFV
jgi:hypothetical protein